MKFTCKCGKTVCGQETSINFGKSKRLFILNAYDILEHWKQVKSTDGSDIWLCQYCHTQATALSMELIKITGMQSPWVAEIVAGY